MKMQWLLGALTLVGVGCDVVLGIEPGVSWCQGKPNGELLPAAQQVEGDCRQLVCDGNGGTKFEAFANDLPPDDKNSCTKEECVGSTLHIARLEGPVECYGAPLNTKGVGICRSGTIQCNNGVEKSECEGQVLPGVESCIDELDNDCNGQVNEGGVGCDCVPGEQKSCYSGPAQTQNIGTCQAGQQSCNADGRGYGPCIGEVLPRADTCDAAAADEDCDGLAGCTTLAVKIMAPSMGTASLDALAVDGQGNVVISGAYQGEWQLGGTVLPAPSGNGYFMAKLDSSGNLSWVRSWATPSISENHALAIGNDGSIFLAGSVGTYGGGTAPNVMIDGVTLSGGNAAVYAFVLRFDKDTGVANWGHTTTGGWAIPMDIAVDSFNNVYVTGAHEGAVSWGGAALNNNIDKTSIFLAALSGSGNPVWSHGFGTICCGEGLSVGLDMNNQRVHMTGRFLFPVNFGDELLQPFNDDGYDIFTVSFTLTGDDARSQRIPGMKDQSGLMAIGPSGIKWFGGISNDTVYVGNQTLTPLKGNDAFVAVYDANDMLLYAKMYPGSYDQSINKIAVGANGRAAILGTFAGDVNIEGTMLVSKSANDIFVTTYENDYSRRWTRAFGSTGSMMNPEGLAIDATGAIWVGGNFSGTVDFGQGPVTSDNQSIFLVKIAP